MNRTILLAYQFLAGVSDTATGALLLVAPALTLRLMGLHPAADTLPFQSFIGAFVLSVGLACLYGFRLMARRESPCRVEGIWQLTAITRGCVAVYVFAAVAGHTLEAGWVTVGLADAACVAFQGIGLRRGWLAHVAR